VAQAVEPRGGERGRASAARRVAYRVVQRVLREGAYAGLAFRAEAARARLGGADRAFAQRLAYGTVQRRRTLDYVLTAVSARPLDRLDPRLHDALRLGVFQLLYMDSVPDHAAVAESVELAKDGGAAHRFANAVLRRVAREGADVLAPLTDRSPADAAVLHSHPEWIARMWWDALGADDARALLARDNVAAETAVRANELLVTAAELRHRLGARGVETAAAPHLPEGLVLRRAFDVEGSSLFREGALTPQSRASMLVTRVLAPQPGERALDLAAAPGTKVTHMAALMAGRGELVAVDSSQSRLQALERNCERMHATLVRARLADATQLTRTDAFDRVLLDAPCTGLGTLQGRPDARWRKSPEQVERLAELQSRLLASAAGQLRPGGTLVYSTCTISPRENEERVRELLAARGDLEADDLSAEYPEYAQRDDPRFLQLLPHRDGTDGFFMARLVRSER
jgi:16S rRNA (cytosine967-C5)-methyltransferase